MTITTKEWEQITTYIAKRLCDHMFLMTHTNGYPAEAVPKATVLSLPALVKLEDYLAATNTKKERKKAVIEGEHAESWRKLWDNWPTVKSIPGRPDMKSTASAKSKEEVCYKLYVQAIESGKVTPAQLNWAAYVYIQGAIEESLRKGRNELVYRNGLEPFLRGAVYMNYIDQPEPVKHKTPVTNSVDM